MSHPLILASGSPRRKIILQTLRIPIEIVPSDIDETPKDGEAAEELVKRLAWEKAKAVAVVYPTRWILGCDTVVEMNGRILGKPQDADDAKTTLKALQASTHHVHTGICLLRGGESHVAAETTVVRMHPMSDAEIDWYVKTDEPLDKAGSYAIQGIGGLFVAGTEGSYSNIIGLPIERLIAMLKDRELFDSLLGIA